MSVSTSAMSAYQLLRRSLEKNGLAGTWSKGLRHLSASVRWSLYRRAVAQSRLDAKGMFTLIYRKRIWSECDTPGASISGYGSSLAYTAGLRLQLADILRALGTRTMFDAPCGDFNWMRLVEFPPDMTYIGADIVDDLIRENLRRHPAARRQFRVFDIARDAFPQADLWFCRDCLFHLSYRDIHAALGGFVRSGIPYLLTTTHDNHAGAFANHDIRTGDWRRIDLCADPFGLPRQVEHAIVDFVPPEPPRKMCLWTRAQVADSLPRLASAIDSR